MVVFNTIVELLKFKVSASYMEIASVSGLKKLEVLKILNNNSRLITKSRNGNVVGLCAVDCVAIYELKHRHMMFNDLIAQQWKE